MAVRRPTPRQLALAADIATRYAATHDLGDEHRTHVEAAAALMGMSALAAIARSEERRGTSAAAEPLSPEPASPAGGRPE